MNKKILSLTLIFAFTGILMTSCVDDSKKKAEDAQKELVEKNQKLEEKTKELRAETIRNWEEFKAASDEALIKRENDIKEIRANIAKADKKQREKLNAQLEDLERKNNELKERIATRSTIIKDDAREFNEKVAEDYKAAEKEFKRDMDDLGNSISNFFKKDNK